MVKFASEVNKILDIGEFWIKDRKVVVKPFDAEKHRKHDGYYYRKGADRSGLERALGSGGPVGEHFGPEGGVSGRFGRDVRFELKGRDDFGGEEIFVRKDQNLDEYAQRRIHQQAQSHPMNFSQNEDFYGVKRLKKSTVGRNRVDFGNKKSKIGQKQKGVKIGKNKNNSNKNFKSRGFKRNLVREKSNYSRAEPQARDPENLASRHPTYLERRRRTADRASLTIGQISASNSQKQQPGDHLLSTQPEREFYGNNYRNGNKNNNDPEHQRLNTTNCLRERSSVFNRRQTIKNQEREQLYDSSWSDYTEMNRDSQAVHFQDLQEGIHNNTNFIPTSTCFDLLRNSFSEDYSKFWGDSDDQGYYIIKHQKQKNFEYGERGEEQLKQELYAYDAKYGQVRKILVFADDRHSHGEWGQRIERRGAFSPKIKNKHHENSLLHSQDPEVTNSNKEAERCRDEHQDPYFLEQEDQEEEDSLDGYSEDASSVSALSAEYYIPRSLPLNSRDAVRKHLMANRVRDNHYPSNLLLHQKLSSLSSSAFGGENEGISPQN